MTTSKKRRPAKAGAQKPRRRSARRRPLPPSGASREEPVLDVDPRAEEVRAAAEEVRAISREQELTALRDNPLLVRLLALLAWVGEGRDVPGDGDAGYDGIVEAAPLVGASGLTPITRRPFTSRSQVPELSRAWAALVEAGLVAVDGERCSVSEAGRRCLSGDPDQRAVTARAALEAYLVVVLHDDEDYDDAVDWLIEDPDEVDEPVAQWRYELLVECCAELAVRGGIDVPALRRRSPDASVMDYEIGLLVRCGLLTRDGDVVRIDPALRHVVVRAVGRLLEAGSSTR